ncbi:phage shock protein C [Novosphingobium chloroacetimidivorans]|uniref:Phage shock protein C n=1 Tax=Novosphingobium chloroacetimidivorans TaxID=1428314 RepID=A0A7W7NW95_9SPHN|nr:PspC domain-containing protein [Novosphingobium chloroacetimidivorans]MBB4858199.1 phage shock protein C [Novosphingobium chloroacetimidivorans]
MARGQFYLDKSNAKLAGVCAGIADYTQVDALWVRIAAVFLTLFVSFITIPIYIVTALAANKRPMALYSEAEEERLLRRMQRSRSKGRYRSELSDMDRRVAEIEARYSTSNARLAAEIDSLR